MHRFVLFTNIHIHANLQGMYVIVKSITEDILYDLSPDGRNIYRSIIEAVNAFARIFGTVGINRLKEESSN